VTTPSFPLVNYWWLYLVFSGFVILLLVIDLALHRKHEAVSFRQAALWTAVWVSLALAFSYALYAFAGSRLGPGMGRQLAMEFLAGYVVEESLSIDNMFVFALVFRYFAVPLQYQHRVLFYGVLGAMVFRGVFIGAGSALIRFEWVLIAFGLFLIYSGIRLAVEREKPVDPNQNWLIRIIGRRLPVTKELYGARFFTRIGGVLHATPLLIVLLFLESTDVMFAVDSVPAVFGVTREPFVVYSSNIFAVLGLRSMFFLLSGALQRFHVLKHGLAIVLVFVGLKMVWLDRLFGGRFPIAASLIIIVAVIGVSIALSLLFPKPVNASPGRIHVRRAINAVVGTVYLALAAAAILYAANLAGNLIPSRALARVGMEPFWVSAICYAFCGTILLLAKGTREGRRSISELSDGTLVTRRKCR
jgi:tellurite resistance protein TerC